MSQPRTTFLGVALSDGVRRHNLIAYMFIALVSSGYAGLLAMLEPGLLQVLEVPFEEQGLITGNLRVMQELVYIALMGVFGVFADRIGRRLIYVCGMLCIAFGYTIYPFASSIEQLVLYRLIIAAGGAAMMGMMITVISDYTRNETRGRANGIQGLMATLGAFIPPLLGFVPKVLVDQGYSEVQALQGAFIAAGSLGLLGAIIGWFGLAKTVGIQASAASEKITDMLKHGLRAARDPATGLSYGAAFISRGDLAVTGAFMGLWFVQYGVGELGMSFSEAMGTLSAPRVFTTVFGALVGAILMGIISDKISKVAAVSLASGMAAVVYLAIYFVDDPTANWVWGLMFLMGIAEISAFVSSQALVGQQAPEQRRGAVIGFFGTAGAVGILVGSGGGGWLFKHYGPTSPFVLFGVLNLTVFIWSLWVKRIHRDG
ncbi:MFS transporter [Oceanicoccus sp. KOV_DT_Chl]|uniref:MFS transporter n=1 Tax=Oceanicoccus sp. KOV_DT_Chl TaxID=1904639 RepID=UPI000C7E8373|nr:MFS transporter [Oceanicoccus sp. KOV_DT_Chl]